MAQTQTIESFDVLVRKHKMHPICRVQDEEHGDILIADSGQAIIEKNNDGDWVAYYRTMWAIFSDEGYIGAWNDYPVAEMGPRTERGAQEFRVNEALENGRKILAQTAEAGLYDHRIRTH